jgi:ribosomal protein L36
MLGAIARATSLLASATGLRAGLSPAAPVTSTFVRWMKVRSAIKKRCEACYFVRRGKISYVYCKVHPRHKQRQGPKHKQGTVERPSAGFTHWTTRGVKWT